MSGLRPSRLCRWAHQLGHGGHFLTKSCRYSVTFGQLRRARAEHRHAQRHPGGQRDPWGRPLNERAVLIISTWTCQTHIIPALGPRKLRELGAEDVDKWLACKAQTLSTATLQKLHSCLNRAIKRAMARDNVRRNVVALCTVPQGQPGRPSKALTMAQAEAILAAAAGTRLYAYIVVSLLPGARTEELRALTWDHVHLVGQPESDPAVPPYIEVWRSVRAGGDTKTRKSRRTLALPARCVDALRDLQERQQRERTTAGARREDHNLVFASRYGTPLVPSASRWRRSPG